ncbi:peptidylprolyl isomerase [Shewanella sp. YLB-07]|uniref:peptidylprolyl isomerase n=1 Tax=Shewanella sp. YLB-07 TaxID=2601268 RepID=UPI001D13C17C|nr:peptidylprolyl isomerase [Shewanella sp. YLB-07]
MKRVVIMSSCGASTPIIPSKESLPVITVNGVTIEEIALANELQYHANSYFDVVVQQAGQTLVIRQLLIEQAKIKGFDISESNEESNVQRLLEQMVSYDDPSEDDCLRYFENNRQKFATRPLMEVDHILLAAAKDDFEGRDDAKTDSEDIIAQLQKDPTLFASLAKHHSACPSKETGGALGQISAGQTVPEFERQLMLLPEGLATKAIESRYGLHVVNIARKIKGESLDYVMVADKIRGYLVHRSSHLAIQAYIHRLVEKADISGIQVRFLDENIHV